MSQFGQRTITSVIDWSGSKRTKINVGIGMEYLIHPEVGISTGIDYHYLMKDDLDEVSHGKYNDSYWRGYLGLRIYFGQ